jgi:methyltransferase family protein
MREMLNQLVRYAPLLPALRRDTGSILEIGSGADGISVYLRRKVVGLEIRFPGPPGAWLTPVGGSATRLPFADASFDTVLVMDTMEHIPPPLRRMALDEAVRVARKTVIVGGPMGPQAREADERLASAYTKRGLNVPDWLAEHLAERAPDVEDIAGPLRDKGLDVTVRGNENLRAHIALMRAEMRPLAFKVLGRIRRHAPGPAATLARTIRFGPYYSWLVAGRRRSSASDQAPSTEATRGSQA